MNGKISIDINCDLGEGRNRHDADKDASLMPYISSCNIACGGHAGNKNTIEYAVQDALQYEIKIGAHPGYADPENFGRKSIANAEAETVDSLKQQIELFLNVAEKNNAKLNHIKLHGALYNDVEVNAELASSIVEYFYQTFPDIEIYGLAQGNFQKSCEEKELKFIPEGFMDRRYAAENQLAARTLSGAVIIDDENCIQQAIALAKKQTIKTLSGESISPVVKTICLHGDNENALDIARKLNQALLENNILIG